ncbi:uncharacterized protein LOC121785982 [Salvia splendens]|uniref:uncharacterized protein LOC121785982 n=1 Tax=Salvia splendens TaxID=180675 RepID=UPI001C267879|nr:uncharacterized protein LOC121785982 [Salvia splendens]
MMQSQQRQLLRLSSAANFIFPSRPPPPHHLYFSARTTNHYSTLCSAQLSEEVTAVAISSSPIHSVSSLLSASADSSLQTAASLLITGAFSLFLFRTFRRRAKQQKKLRSALAAPSLELKGKKKRAPPSADETLLGGLIAAAFGILLYKFTTSVEQSLNSQPLSPNYSVRQITITIRTIINGMCYLATFVFGFNSVGLFLYTGQLAMNRDRVSEDKPNFNSSDRDQTTDNQNKTDGF